LIVLVAALAGIAACGSDKQAPEPEHRDLIGEFTEYCFSDEVEVSELDVSGTLVFDTPNLPSIADGGNKLVLGCDADNPWGANSALEFYFPGTLGPEIDPGLHLESGWKVEFSGAAAVQCTTCFNEDGPARVVYLQGSLDSITFVHDPFDSLTIYIDVDPQRK